VACPSCGWLAAGDEWMRRSASQGRPPIGKNLTGSPAGARR
jgi:hypothetical protein